MTHHRVSTTEAVVLRARRRPRQARSQVTVSAILEATVRVLLKHGYRGCTTRRVAEVAGVGIGSLYEYFPNREALIAAVVEREAERCIAVLYREMTVTVDRPFAETLRAAVGVALSEVETRRELVTVLLSEYPYVGQLAVAGHLPERAADLAASCLHRWAGDVSTADHPFIYQVLANMLIGACLSQILRPADRISRDATLDAVVEILQRILRPRTEQSRLPALPTG